MRRSFVALLLPALGLLGGITSAADICTVFVAARAGDTCASLADAASITVSQFLRANPAVTSCTILSSGTRYCVDPNYNAVPASPAAPVASSPPPSSPSSGSGGLQVTTDGQCGNGYTCLGSAFGDCCSAHGWCGSTTDHCGATCQSSFGKCNGGGGGSNPSQPVSAVVPTGGGNAAATTTVYVTTTRLVSVTAGVATATQIVRQTVPVTVTVGGGGGNNGVATTTSTVLVTSTHSSLVFISSTVTTIKTVTITDAKQCRTAQATPLPRARAAVRDVGLEEREEVLQPGAVNDCRTFYKVTGEDSCEKIVERHNGAFELSQLYSWNRHLSDDCQGLWLDHWVCVGV
ncbi:hypothetical protein QBC47DRAFT_457273 [Echria macrotheca]|uniref:Carbohydrate-binding module family 18 protein n=1 Tax=Echria macrotheca TaxID=438768 RepID=A0AAJ0BIG8_9PEZI|nr:hypothetical protein QBC47DRAFT_457273 [Echria macrotheca]